MRLFPSALFAGTSIVSIALSVSAQATQPVAPGNLPRKIVSIDPAARVRDMQIKSPDVNADRTVTFRYVNATAKSVALSLEGVADPIPMTRNESGLWTVTTEPLAPEYYGYRFLVDGERPMDPRNPDVRPNLQNPSNVAHVPGSPAKEWDLTDISHGELHHHFYTSKLATDEPGLHDRDLYVYTPPTYDAKRKKPYPVLYLLHGYSDDAQGWLAAGQANLILDSLIAQHKIEPMVVVMPRAYGTMRMISEGWGVWTAPYTLPLENQKIFTDMMLKEIIPLAESKYDIAHDAAHRAIAGLSMGGGHSISTGLNHPEVFGYVGAFSSAIVSPLAMNRNAKPGEIDDATYNSAFSGIVPNTKTQAPLKLFWLSCGTEDGLITVNRRFGAWAKTNVKGNVSVNETSGMHTWLVWRDNLVTFSQLLWK